ncbi:hypothetical protein ACN4EG_02575 [Alkalinema pantanalense CENA528]|uniref:hypothetical protein n=1 Tax=Alkalinema pantanalense TaxID=1620705 RepID=UPI003D6E392E
MVRKLRWLGWSLLTAIVLVVTSFGFSGFDRLLAQTPAATPVPAPTQEAPVNAVPISPLPGSRVEPPSPSPSPSPLPTAVPVTIPSGQGSPSPTASPPPLPIPTAPPVALPSAPALPVAGEYKDPTGRFRVAKLKDYQFSPLGDSFLAEAIDGKLSYTVLAQSLAQLNLPPVVSIDQLVQVAKTAFQRGEGFQVTNQQPLLNGVLLDWAGALTIGGQTQPVSGSIVAKQVNSQVLLLLIAATEAGKNDVPGALTALNDSLQGL